MTGAARDTVAEVPGGVEPMSPARAAAFVARDTVAEVPGGVPESRR